MTQLQTVRFKHAENERNVWWVVPENGTPFDAVVEPGFWAHVSAKLRPGDRIEVMSEDGAYFAELLVQDAGRLYAKVAVLRKVDLEATEVLNAGPTAEGYSVKWSGPHSKFRVLRKTDVLRDGFQTKAEANTWLNNHLKAVA